MSWITQIRILLGGYLQAFFLYFVDGGGWFCDRLSDGLRGIIDCFLAALQWASPSMSIMVISIIAFALRRSIAVAIFTAIGLALIVNQGYWQGTTETLALVIVSTCISMMIGVPIGVFSARHQRFYAVIRLLLDLMQTIPTFIYLIPAMILFGLGMVPGLIATIVFVVPTSVRLTQIGIRSTPPILTEAARAFGATSFQVFYKVELPFAIPQIMVGLTQTIMLSLSMVVIAALVGAEGLGTPVLRALNNLDIGKGFESGFCIVILAIILDRMFSISVEPRDMT
ncbi:proline/glycine betaine ABC transporter permease [Candidatus Liberibacter sp.]|uniref:ABC transporter permease n=1 Tax=Candidatus Liberibacter sp. TaxID=34022 RepID=UPI0015F3800E|nr:ABC transporter permease subunit [Candidatus Liberibacter sp.]MBA5723587.1 ABC transporter permease subunit [Candidatus Liberibacter sp.]